MYLETRDINQIIHIYSTAWKKGLKSTYYLHMKPQHNAEQSTTQVNKSEAMGRKGFAAMRVSTPTTVSVATPTGTNFGSVEASAHVDPNTSEITVDIEAKVATNQPTTPSNTNFAGGRPNIINAADFGEDPAAGMVCDSCQ
jgi:hypothetical protein